MGIPVKTMTSTPALAASPNSPKCTPLRDDSLAALWHRAYKIILPAWQHVRRHHPNPHVARPASPATPHVNARDSNDASELRCIHFILHTPHTHIFLCGCGARADHGSQWGKSYHAFVRPYASCGLYHHLQPLPSRGPLHVPTPPRTAPRTRNAMLPVGSTPTTHTCSCKCACRRRCTGN